MVVALPFFPDEKLVRLKLMVFELGIIALLAAAGSQTILRGPGINPAPERKALLAAIKVWLMVQIGLFFFSKESSLAQAELRRVLLGAGAFTAFFLAALSEKWKSRFFATWSLAGGLMALYGILQHTGGVGRVMVPQMNRVMGSFGNPIFFAAYLVPTFFISLAAYSSSRKSLLKGLTVLAMGFQLSALWLTQTRAAWLALSAGLFVLGLVKFPSAKARLALLALFVVGGGLFVMKTKTIWERDQGHLLIWRDTLRMTRDYPVTGVGLGAFHVNFPAYAQPDLMAKWPQGQFIVNYAHNEYLQQLAEGGILGFLSFMCVLSVFGWGVLKRPPSSSAIFIPLAALALVVQNLFSVDMRFGISFGVLFILMGLWAGDERISDAPHPALSPTRRGFFAVIWIALMAALIPAVMRPYRAQKIVGDTPGFFDERMVDPHRTIQKLEQTVHSDGEIANLERLAYAYAKEIQTPDRKINPEMAHKAIEAYEKILTLDPNRASASNNLANIYYTIGKPEAAIPLWRKTVDLQPNFLDARLNLGKVLYLRGSLKESAAQFEEVLKLDPKNAEAIVYLKRMVE